MGKREENFIEKMKCHYCYKDKTTSNGILFFTSEDKKHCICENCVDILHDLAQVTRKSEVFDIAGLDLKKKTKTVSNYTVPDDFTPQKIKEQLDEYVIGQERAKKVLSIAAYNHYIRCANPDLNIDKTNVLLCGPSGCGKTFLVETLANILDVPFVTIDITAYSETGYKGKDPSEIIQALVAVANGDIEKAQRGIVFIDEIDKTAGMGTGSGVGDVKVQSALLKMVDGVEQDFGTAEHGESLVINTRNIMFIFAGAFAGIDEKKQKRTGSMGFNSTTVGKNASSVPLDTKDLISYGMLPELIGRMHRIIEMNPLTQNDLIDILKNSKKSACKQYIKLLEAQGISLEILDESYETIANAAISSKLGARALRGIVEDTMEDWLYNAPTMMQETKEKKIIISKDMVKDGKGNYVEKK